MEQFKSLVANVTGKPNHNNQEAQHKDKLAATKQHDREVQEALKIKREQEKQYKEEERLATCKANRFERAFFHTSKRFAKDERERQKKEAKEATGFTCEHGVWRCRICNPVTKHK